MKFFQKNILTSDDLKRISETVQMVEKETIGEIRVCVQKRRSFRDRNMPVFELAVKNFFELGMQKTKEKTGVLIFLLLSDRVFQIIGDEGINAKVPPEFWSGLAVKMGEHFKQNKYADGICHTVAEVGAILKKEFPARAGDTNELSNDVAIT